MQGHMLVIFSVNDHLFFRIVHVLFYIAEIVRKEKMMDLVPNEIWCMIFSYLDEKSVKNATLTCKFWFELIRSSPYFSSHIILQNFGLEELEEKIKNSDWLWNRWPALKTLELEGGTEPESASEAIALVKAFKFEMCPTLENVIFSVNFDLIELSPNCHPKVGMVGKLNFNPKVNQTSFGIEHVLWMIFPRGTASTEKCSTLNFVGQNAKNITDLTVSICQWPNIDILKTTFENMFKGLSNTLKTLEMNNMDGLVVENIVLNALSENCYNLENLNVYPNQRYWTGLPELKSKFRNLRTLTVPTFYHIDCLLKTCVKLHELCVERVSVIELKNFNVADIRQRFRNLRKIEIYVIVTNQNDLSECSEWSKELKTEDHDIIKVHHVNQGFVQLVG